MEYTPRQTCTNHLGNLTLRQTAPLVNNSVTNGSVLNLSHVSLYLESDSSNGKERNGQIHKHMTEKVELSEVWGKIRGVLDM